MEIIPQTISHLKQIKYHNCFITIGLFLVIIVLIIFKLCSNITYKDTIYGEVVNNQLVVLKEVNNDEVIIENKLYHLIKNEKNANYVIYEVEEKISDGSYEMIIYNQDKLLNVLRKNW